MLDTTSVSVESDKSLASISEDVKDGRLPLLARKLIVGVRKTRAAHSSATPLEITPASSESLAQLMRALQPGLVEVHVGVVTWSLCGTLDDMRVQRDIPYFFVVFTCWPANDAQNAGFIATNGANEVRRKQLALPANIFLQTRPDTAPKADVRLAIVSAVPMNEVNLSRLGDLPAKEAKEEVIVHVPDASKLAIVGHAWAIFGNHVKDLGILLGYSMSLYKMEVGTICELINIKACTSLCSLTLSVPFVRGECNVAAKHMLINIGLLEDVPSSNLCRIQFVIIVGGEGLCSNTFRQVKQTHWGKLLRVLGRFPGLEEVAISIEAKEGKDSEIFQEIYGALQPFMPARVRLVQRYGYLH